MSNHKDKDELEDVEAIPREQAEQEMKQAVKNLQQKQGAGKGSQQKDELSDVESIPREQAEQEIRDAVKRVKNEKK